MFNKIKKNVFPYRVATNEDILNRLLISSDPFITLSKKLAKKKNQELTEDIKNLLII